MYLSQTLAGVFLTAISLAACAPKEENFRAEPPPEVSASEPSVDPDYRFFVIGDAGNRAEDSGLPIVSRTVRRYCDARGCDFGIMTGDNIYPRGAAGDSGDTELFQKIFIEPFSSFSALGEDFSIYVGLGNHDWYTSRKGALAQVDFHERTPPFYMERLFYSVQPSAARGEVEIFVIDTEMLLAPTTLTDYEDGENGAQVPTGKSKRGGDENALPQTEREARQIAWLDNALARSTAKWKLVVGHHPLWQSRSDSKYSQSIKMRELLLPTLCKYADAYLAGHQHTLELQTDNCGNPEGLPLVHIVSGAGSKARNIDIEFQKWQLEKYPQYNQIWSVGEEFGFTYIALSGDAIEVDMITVDKDGSLSPHRYSFANRP